MNNIVKAICVVTLSLSAAGCEPPDQEVPMSCSWVMYGHVYESFVFNIGKKQVYWVNENKRLPLLEVNEGRIVFEGKRSELKVGNDNVWKDVPIRFTVDRVTGDLTVEGVDAPDGYDNSCKRREKVI